mgnify:CR=1 FL=1
MKKILLTTAGLVASISTPIIANAACVEHTSSNSAHISAGRAYVCSAWYACAEGSGENLGMNNSFTTTTLKEEDGFFSKGTCPVNVGDAPEVGSWALGLDEPNYTPSMIDVIDADGDLYTLEVKVTNNSNDDISMLNCAFDFKDGSLTEYRSTSCDMYIAPQWGSYTFTPIATDAQGNVTEGEPMTQDSTIGSAAPTIAMATYYMEGTVLHVSGTAADVDGDLDRIIIGAGIAFGMACEGTSNWTCTVETTGNFPPGHEVEFTVYARDSVENMSDMEIFSVEIPEAQAQECFTATNSAHIDAGRAKLTYIFAYALGSNDYLGYSTNTTSLEKVAEGNWIKVASCN